jgi:hypothetical protein
MSEITREQFAAAVAAAISSVSHVYREVDRLMAGLRDVLAEGPELLRPLHGMSMGKAGRDPGRLVLRFEYGTLLGASTADDDDFDEEDEDEGGEDELDEVENERDEPTRKKRRPAEIAADQPLLAIRIGMYDADKQAAFEPQLEYAVMNDWKMGDAMSAAGDRFILQRYMLRRIPRALAWSAGVEKGGRLVTRSVARRASGGKKATGKDRRLSCELPCGVEIVPLYSLDTADQLDRLAERMKAMWREAVTPR